MNGGVWIKGLIAAMINGAATTITVLIADPEHFNPTAAGGLRKLGVVVMISGIFGAAMYLKQSPLPGAGGKPNV